MPTANFKTNNVSSNLGATSNGTLGPIDSSILSENSVLFTRSAMNQRKNRSLETRSSDMKSNANDYYGKPTKSFEYRRRANLLKAREMAVKMENYNKNRELPILSAMKSPSRAASSPTDRNEVQQSRRCDSYSRSATTTHTHRDSKSKESKENKSETGNKTSDTKIQSKTARSTGGGGISNLSFRLKESTTVHYVEPRPPRHKNVECQTSASELMNWHVQSDSKVMQPSPALWAAILKKREDDVRRSMLREERFVPEYSKSEVNYQTNLKEFLETGTVRHYDREFENQNDFFKPKSTKSDDLKRALRYKPRVQPEMDLKKRLPKIEEELLRAYKGRT